MELSDTVKMMTSEDYKERFRAEYEQTKTRTEKLHCMLVKYEAGTLSFTPSCPPALLKRQENVMRAYLDILEVRAEIEGLDLGEATE